MAIRGAHGAEPAKGPKERRAAAFTFIAFIAAIALNACGPANPAAQGTQPAGSAEAPLKQESSPVLVAEGQRVFRFETFGDEQLWTDKLRMHEVIEKSVDPTTALKVGLKVDADALPPGILEKVDLKSLATTVALLEMNAVMPGIGRRKDGWPNRCVRCGSMRRTSTTAARPRSPTSSRITTAFASSISPPSNSENSSSI